MSILSFLKPTKSNLNTFLTIGSLFIFISFLDVFLNSFYQINFTNFLPKKLNFVFPLIIGFIGLYFIRIEKSGCDFLDSLNKNINTNKLPTVKNVFKLDFVGFKKLRLDILFFYNCNFFVIPVH